MLIGIPELASRRVAAMLGLFLAGITFAAGCGSPTKTHVKNREFFYSAASVQQGPMRCSDLALLARRDYRVGPDDLLSVRIWGVVDADVVSEYDLRVSKTGTISLPLVGEIEVSGKTLAEVEQAIDDAYSPAYIRNPQASVKVEEYAAITVSVVGQVNTPGLHKLSRQERTVLGALMKAGGPTLRASNIVRIQRAAAASSTGGEGSEESSADESPLVETVRLPLTGTEEKFVDVPLEEGDVVVLEEMPAPTFFVTGLVKRPSSYTMPQGAKSLSLMQAISCAGGLDTKAKPKYVTVHRRLDTGERVAARFDLAKAEDGPISKVAVLPGDIVSVDETAATRTNAFFDNLLTSMFRVGVGAGAYFNAVP